MNQWTPREGVFVAADEYDAMAAVVKGARALIHDPWSKYSYPHLALAIVDLDHAQQHSDLRKRAESPSAVRTEAGAPNHSGVECSQPPRRPHPAPGG